MNIRYEIDESLAIRMWVDDAEEPFLYQPHYPNGDVWESSEEAELWAIAKVSEMTDPSAPFAPIGKGLSGTPKPTAEEIAESNLRSLGISVDALKSLLGLQ